MQIVKQVLTIPNGAAVSDEEIDTRVLGAAASVTIIAPAALTNVCKAEVGDVTGGTFGTLQSPAGADVALAAGKSVVLPAFAAGSLRIKSAGNEGADRQFIVLTQSWR